MSKLCRLVGAGQAGKSAKFSSTIPIGGAVMAARWFIEREGRATGPVSVEQLKQMAGSGELSPESRVNREGMKHWVKAKQVRGLFDGVKPVAEDPFGFLGGTPDAVEREPEPVSEEFDFFGGGAAVTASLAFESEVPVAAAMPVEEDEDVPSAAAVEESTPVAAIRAEEVIERRTMITGRRLKGEGSAELELLAGWLVLRFAGSDGEVGETWLRVERLWSMRWKRRSGRCVMAAIGDGVRLALECDESAAKEMIARITREASGGS